MSDDELIELVITCQSWQKAHALVDELFALKLLRSAEFIPSPASSLVMAIYRNSQNVNVVIQTNTSDIASIKIVVSKAQYEVSITQGTPAVNAGACGTI
ncbi:MAG TPA: hypothetical protein VMQ52_00735 [Candidatus Saccharimonadales bacterium]|nr:hypothetical protein [Candidatus Saccharimonadales bacterium]